MMIEKILKQLTPERIKKEIETIQKIKLPFELHEWVREYEKVGRRERLIWWVVYKSIREAALPGVVKKYQKSLMDTNFLITMFVILVGDVATIEKNKNLLKKLLDIPFNRNYKRIISSNSIGQGYLYLKFTRKVWNHIRKTIKKYPRYREFNTIFQHDIEQILVSINFSYIVNKNLHLINKMEYWEYFPHLMQLLIHATCSLMCSQRFDIRELGSLRESILLAQKIARITNWVSSWERELKEKDFSSGIFAYALDFKLFAIRDFKKENYSNIVNKIKKSKIEKRILVEWEKYYWELKKLTRKIKSININRLPSQIEELTFTLLSIKNI